MPEELWTEAWNIVQEVMKKNIPRKNKCKRAKWLSEEALQIAKKRREVKGKDISNFMQSSREEQGEISRPS